MHKVGKLIVDSGMWPLYEIVDKKVIMGRKPSMKVDSVLAMQGRFKHLNKTMVKDIQKKVDKEWELIDSNRFWETCEY